VRSGIGTFETCGLGRAMSACRGKPAGVFLLRSLVWNAATSRIALVLLSLVGTTHLPSYMLTVKHEG
jgi:hypothetical protein